MSRWLAVAALTVIACGGDSSDPDDPFPDASGTYDMSGGFDDLPSSVASFEGTLTLTQASQESGDLEGSLSITAVISGDELTLTDDLSPASVSANGEVTFTVTDPSGSWNFTGTLSGSDLTDGRHTLSSPQFGSVSGDWSASRVSGIRMPAQQTQRSSTDLKAVVQRLHSR